MKWMFEHCEAAPIPLGGGSIAHSLIGPAQRAPYHDIRYSWCLPLDRLVRPTRERTWRSTHVGVARWPVFEHREADTTPLGGGTIAYSLIIPAQLAPCHESISVTHGAFLNRLRSGVSNPRAHMEVHTCRSCRGWPVFEHP